MSSADNSHELDDNTIPDLNKPAIALQENETNEKGTNLLDDLILPPPSYVFISNLFDSMLLQALQVTAV